MNILHIFLKKYTIIIKNIKTYLINIENIYIYRDEQYLLIISKMTNDKII